MKEVVIVGAARTAVGSFQGALSEIPAPKLGGIAIKAAVERSGFAPSDVEQVIMGNVLSAGVGQAPARQATLAAGLPISCGALTINKMCGSGLKAVMLASQSVATGESDVVVAGGMESMSLAPYLMPKARTGYRMGDQTVVDHMMFDGLTDAYDKIPMGVCADRLAKEHDISRDEQDEFAARSYTLALESIKNGAFDAEIAPVEIPQRKGDPIVFKVDEEPGRGNVAKLPTLKPVFSKDGTVTAGNASTINDGAAAVVVTSADVAKAKGLVPMAKIVSYATAALAPVWFSLAPVDAMKLALKKAGLSASDIGLWEVNEAFSGVAIAAKRGLSIDPDKLNVKGGAVAIGHPIGGSGARVLTTLLYAMKERGVRYGMASLCIGGGEAVAVVVERV